MATEMKIESVFPYGSSQNLDGSVDDAAVLLKVCKSNEKGFMIHVPFHVMNSLHLSNRAKYLTCCDGHVKNMERFNLMYNEVCGELNDAFGKLNSKMTAAELEPFMNSFIWMCIADVPSDEVADRIQIFNYLGDNYKIYDLYDDCCGDELTSLYVHNFLDSKCTESIVFHPEIVPMWHGICKKCGRKWVYFNVDIVGEVMCRRCRW